MLEDVEYVKVTCPRCKNKTAVNKQHLKEIATGDWGLVSCPECSHPINGVIENAFNSQWDAGQELDINSLPQKEKVALLKAIAAGSPPDSVILNTKVYTDRVEITYTPIKPLTKTLTNWRLETPKTT